MALRTRVQGSGMFVPKKVVKNKDLEEMLNTSDEWIVQRSGIEERRWVEPGDTILSMATEASRQAIQNSNLEVDDIDAIIFGCLVSDYIFPGTGCLLQAELGCKRNIPALDIRNQCSGFIYALQVADAWIRAGMYKNVLIVASEIHSTSLWKKPEGRDVSVLFGDGSGAIVVSANEDSERILLDSVIYSQGEFADKLCLKKPTPNDFPRLKDPVHEAEREWYPFMEGRAVFKHAVTRMCEVMSEICKKNNIDIQDVKMIIPHQANLRINLTVLETLGLPFDRAHHTLQKYGNTTMSTIPITAHEAREEGKIKEGDLVAYLAFGSGFTWGAALVRY